MHICKTLLYQGLKSVYAYMDIRIYGYINIWIYAYTDILIYAYMQKNKPSKTLLHQCFRRSIILLSMKIDKIKKSFLFSVFGGTVNSE